MIGRAAGPTSPIRVDVGHHVVAELLLVLRRGGEVDVVDMRPQLVNLLLRDVEAQFPLGFSEHHPEFSPGGMLHLRRPQRGHLARGVSANERVIVNVVRQSMRLRCYFRRIVNPACSK